MDIFDEISPEPRKKDIFDDIEIGEPAKTAVKAPASSSLGAAYFEQSSPSTEDLQPKATNTGMMPIKEFEALPEAEREAFYDRALERGAQDAAAKAARKPKGYLNEMGLSKEMIYDRGSAIDSGEFRQQVSPFYQESAQYPKDVVQGAIGTIEGTVGAAEALTGSTIAKEIGDRARAVQQQLSPKDPSFIHSVFSGAGSMATFFIPGMGVMKAAQMAKIAPDAAMKLGSLFATFLESSVEAGLVYRDVIERTGGDEAAANEAALKTFGANAALIGVTNRLGVFSDKGGVLRRGGTSAVAEGFQEFSQSGISDVSKGDPINWEQAGESAAVGAVTGGVFGGVSGRMAPQEERAAGPIPQAEQPTADIFDEVAEEQAAAGNPATETAAAPTATAQKGDIFDEIKPEEEFTAAEAQPSDIEPDIYSWTPARATATQGEVTTEKEDVAKPAPAIPEAQQFTQAGNTGAENIPTEETTYGVPEVREDVLLRDRQGQQGPGRESADEEAQGQEVYAGEERTDDVKEVMPDVLRQETRGQKEEVRGEEPRGAAPAYPKSFIDWLKANHPSIAGQLIKQANKYRPDQAGFNIYTDKMAELADNYPDYLERFEAELEAERMGATKPTPPVKESLTPETKPAQSETVGPKSETVAAKGETIASKSETPDTTYDYSSTQVNLDVERKEGAGDIPTKKTPEPVGGILKDDNGNPLETTKADGGIITDSDGTPTVFYHGSPEENIQNFKSSHRTGFFFSTNSAVADQYGTVSEYHLNSPKHLDVTTQGGLNLIDKYESDFEPDELVDTQGDRVSLREIVQYGDWGEGPNRRGRLQKKFLDLIKNDGYTGITMPDFHGGGENEIATVVFSPDQIIKVDSSLPNPSSPAGEAGPNILDNERGEVSLDIFHQIKDKVGDLITSDKTFNFFNKSVNTQYHKAQKDADFRKVFDAGQDYLNDFSSIAIAAEQKAPKLLARAEKFRDYFNLGISKKDAVPLANAVFTGTLDDIVYTDDELRSKFNLTDDQISFYREYRAAIDQSLDDLAKSVISKIAAFENVPLWWSKANREMSLKDFTKKLYDTHFKDRRAQIKKDIDSLNKEIEALDDDALNIDRQTLAVRLDLLQKELENLEGTIANIKRTEAKTEKLKRQGYAPLMRFGNHSVYVYETDATGKKEQLFYGLYESQSAANQAARELAEEFPDATIEKGILSKESYRMFKGLTMDSLELFAEATGMDKNPLVQEFLKQAVNNRSALKRLIHRKGTPGFSDDPTRTLSQFIVSNSRFSAGNYNIGTMRSAIDQIPRGKGDVKDEAVKLYEYLTEPKEEAAKFRGFLFFNYLGGSAAAGLVNTTQPLIITAPYLSKYGNAKDVSTQLTRAGKEAASRSYGKDVEAALAKAEKEGVTAPHEIHQLMAEARVGMNRGIAMRNFMKMWGSFFSASEAWNRRTTFIAAYRIALGKGATDAQAYQFAKRAVTETQFIYNRGNRPNWSRGAIGATVFTFKQFSISYLELVKRMPRNQKILAMFILWLMAGIQGLPFREDIEDMIDTIGQWLGFATHSDKTVKKAVYGLFGKEMGEFVLHGVSGLPSVPLDIQGRMGLHNLIPGTSLLKPSDINNRAREVTEVLGPAGGVAESIGRGVENLVKGKPWEAVQVGLPKALKDMAKAVEMWHTGKYTDSAGRPVVTDASGDEAVIKGLGFQPNRIAKQSRTIGENYEDIAIQKMKEEELAGKIARAVADRDQEGVREAKAELKEWNRNNPDYRVQINSEQIQRRVQDLRRSKVQRFFKSTPKEMKRQVRDSFK